MRKSSKIHKKKSGKRADSSWKLTYDRFDPSKEPLREVLCVLGNGYFGTRGAFPESSATESTADNPPSEIHYPGTYIAGLYNKLATKVSGRNIFNEDMVNCPNWLPMTFKIDDGEWTAPASGNIRKFYQELDIRKGVLSRRYSIKDKKGRLTTVEATVLAHMGDPHRCCIKYDITPENYSGFITIRSGLDAGVQNTGVARYRQLNSKHLKTLSKGAFGKNIIYISAVTTQSGIEIAEAAKVNICKSGREIKPVSSTVIKVKEAIFQEFKIYVNKKKTVETEKICAIYTSKSKGAKSTVASSVDSVKKARGFDRLLSTHTKAWEGLWNKFDVEIEGDPFVEKVLRLHSFHLLQTASIHNSRIDAGLPARGLHGEAYRGHIFWDELFVMPFYTLRLPEISRALLMYRYTRLPAARKYAKENGYKGSMFPWQGGSTGEEETQSLHLNPMSGKWGEDNSRIQRHVSLAIAYNTWRYWEMTHDMDFLSKYGAEMLLSIAHFGTSLTKFDLKDRKYHTEGLMGPDEFHEMLPGAKHAGFRDNAYTNVLIVWIINRAREALELLPGQVRSRLVKKLRLSEREFSRWEDISKKMNIIINKSGVISQFDGYFGLDEIDLDKYRRKYKKIGRMDRILKSEGRSPNDYKIIKQADVLMMFYLLFPQEVKKVFGRLGCKFSKDLVKKNYNYYLARTSHGSTLSMVVHCYISHLIGESRDLLDWFHKVIKSDIYDTQGGTTKEGIHCGVMGGSVDIVMKVFAGVNILTDRIRIEPFVPRKWKSIRLKLWFRGRRISLVVTAKSVTICVNGPINRDFKFPFEISGKLHHLSFEKKYKIAIKN